MLLTYVSIFYLPLVYCAVSISSFSLHCYVMLCLYSFTKRKVTMGNSGSRRVCIEDRIHHNLGICWVDNLPSGISWARPIFSIIKLPDPRSTCKKSREKQARSRFCCLSIWSQGTYRLEKGLLWFGESDKSMLKRKTVEVRTG